MEASATLPLPIELKPDSPITISVKELSPGYNEIAISIKGQTVWMDRSIADTYKLDLKVLLKKPNERKES